MSNAMEGLDLDINVGTDGGSGGSGGSSGGDNGAPEYVPINLEILISTCLKRRYSTETFVKLLYQFDSRYKTLAESFIVAVSSLAIRYDLLLFEYLYETVLLDIGHSKFGLISVWTYLGATDAKFQASFLNGITNSEACMGSVVSQLLAICKESISKETSTYEDFFSGLSQLILGVNVNESELIKEIAYFVGSLVEHINTYNYLASEDGNNTEVNTLLVIPESFIHLVYELSAKIQNECRSLSYLCIYIDDLLKSYFNSLKQASSLFSSQSQVTAKVLKLVWLSNMVANLKTNDKFFLLNYELILKNQLKILDMRSNGFDLKTLLSNLIQSSIEIFCIAVVNKTAFSVLKRWKLFLERHLPLLILRIKENKGVGFSAPNDDDELRFARELSKYSKTSLFSVAIQSAITESISNLDQSLVKTLKLFASDDQEAKNEALIDSNSRIVLVNYSKYLSQNEADDVFASFPSTIIDIRHDFLKSCVALNLIKVDDFAACLKEDAKAEVRLLNVNDIVKDINTGEIVDDLETYLETIFLLQNPEFDAVATSALTKFLFQVPSFEATSQYSLALVIHKTFKTLIAEKKGVFLRRLSLSLLLNLVSLDIIVSYLGPVRFITPLVEYLDAEQQNVEEDLNFQDTFTDFGCAVLLLQFVVKRFNVKLEDITRNGKPSFVIETLTNFGKETEDFNQELVNDWTNELFYSSSGISDELINQSTARQCFKLAQVIFQQAFTAYKENLIDLDVFKNGVEYFFQPFLLVPLLGIFNWLEDQIWHMTPITTTEQKKSFELILNVLSYLLVPVVNEEAGVIHGLILQFVVPSLHQTINKAILTFNSNSELVNSLGQLNIDSSISRLLTNTILKNDFQFNLLLLASNKFFNHNDLILHFTINLVDGDINHPLKYYKPHQHSIFDTQPPLQLLEDQINSLIVWSYSSNSVLNPPIYDPYILPLAVRAHEGNAVLHFFLQIILLYESLVSDGDNVPANSKIDTLKKQILGKKTGSLTQDLISLVADVIAVFIINYSINSQPEQRIQSWSNFLGITKPDAESIQTEEKASLEPVLLVNEDVKAYLAGATVKSFQYFEDDLFIAIQQLQVEINIKNSTANRKRHRDTEPELENNEFPIKKEKAFKLLLKSIKNHISRIVM